MPRKMKRKQEDAPTESVAKKTKMFDEESEDEADGFKVNEDFAKRFEFNNKRRELQQLEDKYGSKNVKIAKREEEDDDEEDDSSTDEDEDDDGEFATVDVDVEIMDTLNAIRNKDPRLYDANAKFYKEYEAPAENGNEEKKEKSMTLKDYHRANFIAAAKGVKLEEDGKEKPRTYAQEQAELRDDVVKAFHNAGDEDDHTSEDDGESFLKAKSRTAKQEKAALPDPSLADKDPENYLSNFFAARAWVPSADSKFAHLESDDDDEDDRAEEFENAYNLRFEDPNVSNTTLKTVGRDFLASTSVRRDEAMNPRKRARERAKQEKEREREEREAGKARLKKLKIEQIEGKLEKIRYAAGEKDVDISEWASVLQEDWNDAKFDEEMQKRFGDKYYEGRDAGMELDEESEDEESKSKTKKKAPKKPTWDDDIDIKDLVSDFEDDEDQAVSLSEDEGVTLNGNDEGDDSEDEQPSGLPTPKKSKSSSKRDRRLIESLATQSLLTDTSLMPSSKKQKSGGPRFAYRETSPTTFGLTALDILAADDAQLNEWAGLKKLATFRDAGKKEKDMRRLGKKGRLREWRKSTFGSKEGPTVKDWYVEGAEATATGANTAQAGEANGESVDVKEGKRKKKRSRGKKNKAVEA